MNDQERWEVDPTTGADDDITARRLPTLEDVAKLAGVSMMTASRAINNERYVSAASSRKVKAAQEALNFVPRQAARQLVTKRTDSIALIAPMADEQLFRDPNIAAVFAGASRALSVAGLQLVVLFAPNKSDRDRVLRYVRAGTFDGAIILSPELLEDLPDAVLAANIPIVATGSLDAVRRIGRGVVTDSEGAIASIAELLVSGGARRIAMIAGPPRSSLTRLQIAGCERALKLHDLVPIIAFGDYSSESGEEEAAELLARHPDIDGLLVVSDVMAAGAIRSITRAGKSVPGDIRVAGNDDSTAALLTNPTLTTVHVPFYDIGSSLASLLIDALAGIPASIRTLDTHVVVRESA